MFSVMTLRLSDHTEVLHNIASSSFFRFRSDFLAFFARISNLLRNLIKQLFHSRLLDMRLVTANSALRASLAIFYISYPTRAHGIIVNYYGPHE